MTVMTRGVGENSRYFSTRVDTRTKAISQHEQAPYRYNIIIIIIIIIITKLQQHKLRSHQSYLLVFTSLVLRTTL